MLGAILSFCFVGLSSVRKLSSILSSCLLNRCDDDWVVCVEQYALFSSGQKVARIPEPPSEINSLLTSLAK